MITEVYLRNVLTGKTFCPKFSDVKLRPCPRPPSKEVLLKKFMKIVADHSWQSVGIDEKHVPDKRWLLDMVSTFTPGDDIFKKDFMPPPKKNKLSEIKSIELPESFLKGLPNSVRKSRRKGLSLAKDGIAGQRLARLKMVRKELENRILDEEEKKESSKTKKTSIRSSTNESMFKSPPKKSQGGQMSQTSSSNRPGSLNSSQMQPQS